LAELTSEDARVLKQLYEEWQKIDKSKLFRDSTLKYGPGVDGTYAHSATAIITLNRLGLITPAFVEFKTYEAGGHDASPDTIFSSREM
jgi:hypothetical protein